MISGINLLPWRKELRFRKARYFKKWISIIFGTVAFLLLWHMILWRQINFETKQARDLQRQISLLEQSTPSAAKTKQQQYLQEIANRIIGLEKLKLYLIQVFENLHHGVPMNLNLTQLIIKNDGVKLFGKTGAMFGISQLINTFTKAKFCNVPLIQKINYQNDEYNFVLSL